jgi:hypothetical protein
MPHVTFVHGLSNKPAADVLLPIWKRALAAGLNGLNLDSEGVSSSMVYWADVLYERPDQGEEAVAYESTSAEDLARADGSVDVELPAIQMRTVEEAEFVSALQRHFTSASMEDIDLGKVPSPEDPSAVALERVPLPWFIKKRIMKAFLRDAHHYYFNKPHTPRPGEIYRVQDEIRRRFVAALNVQAEVPAANGPHIVVSHSMGTMIAYDCLKRVAACPAIDGLITLGSPLGIDEVQDCNKPEWTRADGFPADKLNGRWVNIFDRLDVVCAADPRIAGDFQHGGKDRIEDIGVSNEGYWRHAVVQYLARPHLRETLASMLNL